MQLKSFSSYDEYLTDQRTTILLRKAPHAFFTWVEVKNDCDFAKIMWPEWESRTIRGVCHGARNGVEADEFAKHFKDSSVIGTDLFPYSGSSKRWRGLSEVVEWDFSKVKEEWVGAFDFVYSNSLDHASDPMLCLKTWIGQLKPDGLLFIQWTDCGKVVPHKGDCFTGDVVEVEKMVAEAGRHLRTIHNECEFQKRTVNAKRALVTETIVGARA